MKDISTLTRCTLFTTVKQSEHLQTLQKHFINFIVKRIDIVNIVVPEHDFKDSGYLASKNVVVSTRPISTSGECILMFNLMPGMLSASDTFTKFVNAHDSYNNWYTQMLQYDAINFVVVDPIEFDPEDLPMYDGTSVRRYCHETLKRPFSRSFSILQPVFEMQSKQKLHNVSFGYTAFSEQRASLLPQFLCTFEQIDNSNFNYVIKEPRASKYNLKPADTRLPYDAYLQQIAQSKFTYVMMSYQGSVSVQRIIESLLLKCVPIFIDVDLKALDTEFAHYPEFRQIVEKYLLTTMHQLTSFTDYVMHDVGYEFLLLLIIKSDFYEHISTYDIDYDAKRILKTV